MKKIFTLISLLASMSSFATGLVEEAVCKGKFIEAGYQADVKVVTYVNPQNWCGSTKVDSRSVVAITTLEGTDQGPELILTTMEVTQTSSDVEVITFTAPLTENENFKLQYSIQGVPGKGKATISFGTDEVAELECSFIEYQMDC